MRAVIFHPAGIFPTLPPKTAAVSNAENSTRRGRVLRLPGDAQDCALLVRQKKRRRPLELRTQSVGDRDGAEVRLDAVGLRNRDQSAARESLIPHSICRNRRVRLCGLKSIELIDETECSQMKVGERSLVLRRMKVSHAARVKALVEIVTVTGEPGPRHKEEQEAQDDFLQNVPSF
jgi:hypothetical protein